MNNVNVLILSDSEDFTSDLVCIELHRQGVSYLRIDRDLINSYDISWQLSGNLIITNIETNETFSISKEELSGVYFRAPTYFRETFTTSVTPEIQLKRSQALSMFRNIEYFGQAKWMNAPSRTFFAENKVIQLLYAKEMGFNIPETEITNGAISSQLRVVEQTTDKSSAFEEKEVYKGSDFAAIRKQAKKDAEKAYELESSDDYDKAEASHTAANLGEKSYNNMYNINATKQKKH